MEWPSRMAGGERGRRGRDESGRERIRKNKFVEMRGHDAPKDARAKLSSLHHLTRNKSTKQAVSFSSSSEAVQRHQT
jgi:hypothetical protein